jgi:sulfoxide reductase heme-binding subunit YedZ
MADKILTSRWTKVVVFLACLQPVAALGWRAWRQDLGANPVEFLTHATGDWTLRFLLLTLAVTPLRELLGAPQLIRFRRMLGLFAFFYGCLHLLTYVWFDKFFDVHEMLADIAKRPFITVGFTGLVLMVPLAVTSTAGWIRRMGGRRWQLLHRLIYFSGVAGVIHYYWLVKSDVRLPAAYGGLLFLLLGYRLFVFVVKKRATVQSTSKPDRQRRSPNKIPA